MKNLQRRHLNVLLSSLLLAGAALSAVTAHADQLDTITAAKKIRIAIDMAVPPYGMKDDKLNSTGSDVETAQLLAKDFGLELEIVPTTGANRIPFLQTDKADIVISSLSVTPEREKVVDFSIPYAGIAAVVGAPKGMAITSAADLSGKKVISTRGTTNDQEVTKILPKDATIVRFDDDATSITAIVSNQADIFATAPSLLKTINEKNPAKQMEVKFVMKVNMLAVGFKKGEAKLKEKVDAWVRTNLKNGKLNAIYKKFHGADLPDEVTKNGT
ncbi:transporter substrate-binding domain-containing protein [Variovorax sp. PAMC28562]|uniref:transporter substrate-binding domain-containing protein n=1 Tax=Variovorax sp. PAMC28562 TaxID=2762323 RepID=UPI00164D1333|nr:transporter substrate-binding domain-containing protein [Variovorax sp. PAMC28562]QNK75238.1 transporter substrate-binding domain-containing protein [Variovorax sp. PAMC28562]